MVIPAEKSIGEAFFQQDSIPILISRTVKTRKHASGMETCTKIYFLFIFNLMQMRIRKTYQYSNLIPMRAAARTPV